MNVHVQQKQAYNVNTCNSPTYCLAQTYNIWFPL